MDVFPALITAGTVFAIVAIMHLLRIIYRTEVLIGTYRAPIWVSVIGFLFPLGLSIWMFACSMG